MRVLNDNFLYNPSYHRLASLLDIDTHERQEPRISEKLLFLYDWATKRTDSNSISQILSMVTRLKRDLGTTQRGKTLLTDMYKWVRLDQDSMRLEEGKSALKGMTQETEQTKKQAQKSSIKRADRWQKEKDKQLNIAKDAEKKAGQAVIKDTTRQEKASEKIKSGNIRIRDLKQEPIESQEIKL